MADLIRRHQRRVGSRWRRLPPGRQALVIGHLRRSETFAAFAAAFVRRARAVGLGGRARTVPAELAHADGLAVST
ncbi:hypothetical protein BS35_000933 [Actinomadura glauciflava]|uniref:hypothetical protein n=1 Tax=Actinomadura luteofluorescens TaxID=46163 RepID=UPI0021649B18|nr:hypothetical protein [Actinomadura glauciflava]MCR3738394.1 hypothetical protein [Actinomadura glauciflava]